MQLHGGGPAGLIAREIEATGDGPAMAVVRITYEFLGPVPFVPLTVRAEVVKPGKRFQLVDAELAVAGGPVVVRARAVRLRRGSFEVPGDARGAGPETVPGGPDPDAWPREEQYPHGAEPEAYHVTGMELRFARGSFHTRGAAAAWFRPRFPLVDKELASPLAQVAMAADFTLGVGRVLDFDGNLFINTDLTIHVHREPAGEWVLLDARTELDERGVGVASSTLYDERGALGVSAQSLFVEAR
jgi:acyl-CoA thioesterase